MHNSRERTGREAGRAQGHSVGGLCLRTAQSNTLQCLAYSSPQNLRDILDSPCAAAGLAGTLPRRNEDALPGWGTGSPQPPECPETVGLQKTPNKRVKLLCRTMHKEGQELAPPTDPLS